MPAVYAQNGLSVIKIHPRGEITHSASSPTRESRCLAPRVSAVKTADALQSDRLSRLGRLRFARSTCRRIMDRGVDALGVVVLDVFAQQASQVVFAEHDHVVEKLSANAADEPLCRAVLPSALERGSPGMDSESPDRAGDVGREDRIVVEDHKPMGGFVGEGVA